MVVEKTRVLALSLGYGKLGGVGTVTKELTDALNSRGDHTVDVLTLWPWESTPIEFIGADKTQARYPNLDQFANSLIGGRRYDAVHIHSHIFSDNYLRMLKGNTIDTETFLNRYKAPKILLTHCVVPREDLANGKSRDYQIKLESQKQIMRLSDRIVHLTEEQREIANRFYPDFSHKTVVIGNGTHLPSQVKDSEVEAYRKAFSMGGHEKLGLYIGRISQEKGLSELIEAIPKIKEQCPDFKLLIAGNKDPHDTYEAKIRRRIKELGLTPWDYEFLGWIDDDKEKQRIIRAVDFTLMPSHYEHFPMVALESMINGTPLIISNVKGPRSIFRLDKEDHLALPIKEIRSPKAVAEAIIYALQHEQEMKDMSARAQREVKEKHTWEDVAEQYAELFKDLIAHPEKREKAEYPEVGVVIPTFNRKETVGKTIDSLLKQDFDKSYKVVVVDDGSIDGTFEYLLKKYRKDVDYAEDHIVGKREVISGNGKKIILVRQRNRRHGGAHNTGLRILHTLGCKYFTHQDDGDKALPNRLRTSMEFMEKNPQVDLMHAKSYDIDENGERIEDGYEPYYAPLWEKARRGLLNKGDIKNENYIHNHTVFFRRSIIDKLGINNLYWEDLKTGTDLDFWIKIEEAGLKFGFCDEYVAQSMKHSKFGITNLANLTTIEDIVSAAFKSPDKTTKGQLYKKVIEKGGLELIRANKTIFDDYFDTIFQIIFERNIAQKAGDLSQALTLAEEAVKLSPTEENKAKLSELQNSIAA